MVLEPVEGERVRLGGPADLPPALEDHEVVNVPLPAGGDRLPHGELRAERAVKEDQPRVPGGDREAGGEGVVGAEVEGHASAASWRARPRHSFCT